MTGQNTTARSAPRVLGALAGVLAALAGLGLAEGVAALLAGVTGPFLAVGNRMVDAAPRPLKEFAIEQFGTNDKPVLLGGIAGGLLLLTLVAGALGLRRPRLALGVFAAMAAVAATGCGIDDDGRSPRIPGSTLRATVVDRDGNGTLERGGGEALVEPCPSGRAPPPRPPRPAPAWSG